MASRKTRKAIIYKCDREGCNVKHVAPFTDWTNAWAHAKKEGWRSLRIGGVWRHFCNWIHVPDRRTNSAEVAQAQNANGGG